MNEIKIRRMFKMNHNDWSNHKNNTGDFIGYKYLRGNERY